MNSNFKRKYIYYFQSDSQNLVSDVVVEILFSDSVSELIPVLTVLSTIILLLIQGGREGPTADLFYFN